MRATQPAMRRDVPRELRHKTSSTEVVLGVLASLGVEPYEIFARNRAVYALPDREHVPLAGPYPEAGSDAAECQRPDRETQEFESGDTDVVS